MDRQRHSRPPAQILLVPNASPFHRDKASSRLDLTDAGFDPAVVTDVLRRIDEAEMTRRSTPPRIKVTARAFDQDRRMPLTSNWRAHQRD